ncbi:MAG: hypothetical protein AAGH99_10230 [Planctomycetota bacterium]
MIDQNRDVSLVADVYDADAIHVTPQESALDTARVLQIKTKIESGFYDRPEVVNEAVEELLKHYFDSDVELVPIDDALLEVTAESA